MKAAIQQAASLTASEVAEAVVDGRSNRIVLRAGPGSGASLALREAARVLEAEGRMPILVAPPPRQIDTAALAIADVVAALHGAGAAGGSLEAWLEPCGWWQRLSQAETWIAEAASSSQVVLLIDDPAQWPIPGGGEFSLRCESVLDLLVSSRALQLPTVVVRSDSRERPLETDVPNHRAVGLLEPSGWAEELAPTVGALRSVAPTLAAEPPVAVGLAVAMAALTSADLVAGLWSAGRPAAVVADGLAEVISERRELRPLWASWLSAGMPRRGVPEHWLDDFARTSLDDPTQQAVLDHCLLVRTDGDAALVREVRAASWRVPENDFSHRVRSRAASPLYSLYRSSAEEALGEGSFEFCRLVAEELNLSLRVPEARPLGAVPVPFSDHFNNVGTAALSHSDWEKASTSFSLGLEQDPDDAVALHYLGFSLDNEALEPRRVEHNYRSALRRDPIHASWHERLVSFLVVQARVPEAADQFAASLVQLLRDDGEAGLDVYSRFHQPVAANLLRRSELPLTARVLASIPAWAGERLPGFDAQRHRLSVLEAASEGPSCVPADRAAENWWQQPELLGLRHSDGRPLHTWLAAGVENVSERGLDLQVAVVPKDHARRFGSTTLSWEFVESTAEDEGRLPGLDVGDFLEIGYYGHGSELPPDPVVRVLPRRDWTAGVETPLDPQRYIARAFP